MAKFYKHYKNKPYKYLGTVRHSESLEELVLYECLYPNDLAKIWVRPKDMFHEEIEFQGIRRPRFSKIPIQYKYEERISRQRLEEIFEFLKTVFDTVQVEKISQKLRTAEGIFLLSAWIEEKLIGFKLGYALDSETFYSWLGGVQPELRGLGIAQELMDNQHMWCRDQGYKKIQTKCTNRWKNMMILNLKNGFEIQGTEKNQRGELKIRMEKNLI